MAAFAWSESIYELPRGVGLAICVAHQGEHVYEAGCRALPARRQPYSVPPRRCAEVGCSFAAEAPHSHQPSVEPVRVEIDAEALAVGIATALDGLMQRRRESQQATAYAASGAPASHRREEEAPLGGVPTVT